MGFAEYSSAFFDDLAAQAEASPRRRQHHNLHRDPADPVQRLFNAICVDSYIRPHRHLRDPKRELLLAVRGEMALIAFDGEGAIERIVPFGTGSGDCAGVELDPDQWHTIVALKNGSILLEVKQGPYDAELAKEFAPWAPPEGTPEASSYLNALRARVSGVENTV